MCSSYVPGGRATHIDPMGLATNQRFKDRSGEFLERTEWHTIMAWQRLAEIVDEFVSKGSRVYVEGKLQTPEWKERLTGENKYCTEIGAMDLVFLGSREKGNGVQPHRLDEAEKPKSTQLAGTGAGESSDDRCRSGGPKPDIPSRYSHFPKVQPNQRLTLHQLSFQ